MPTPHRHNHRAEIPADILDPLDSGRIVPSDRSLDNPPTGELQHRLDPAAGPPEQWPPADRSSAIDALTRLTNNPADTADTTSMVPIPAQELVDLYRKLRSQPVIEEAKGILMGHYGLRADTAFLVLQRWSQTHNVKLTSVAQALVDAAARQPSSQVPPATVIEQAFNPTHAAPN